MEDKPLTTFIPKRRKIKTFVATRTHIPTTYTYIPDTIPDTYIPETKAKKKRSRFLKLLKRVFGFLWGVFLKVFEIAFLVVASIIFGVVMGIISWLEEESAASARRNYEEEERRRKEEEEERRRREEEWWVEENERYRKWLAWKYYEDMIQTGQTPGPNPYQNPYL